MILRAKDRPIGIFDSGLGGLTVLKEIQNMLPNENLIYFGDSGRAPYGTKSKETVIRYTFQDIGFLMSKHVKMIVIACNTASACSLPRVIANCDIPVVEVVGPGSRAASGGKRLRLSAHPQPLKAEFTRPRFRIFHRRSHITEKPVRFLCLWSKKAGGTTTSRKPLQPNTWCQLPNPERTPLSLAVPIILY